MADNTTVVPRITEEGIRKFAADVEHFRRTGDQKAYERAQRKLRAARGTPDYDRLDRIVRRS